MLYTVITVMVLGVVHRCQSLGERMSRDISQCNGMCKTFLFVAWGVFILNNHDFHWDQHS